MIKIIHKLISYRVISALKFENKEYENYFYECFERMFYEIEYADKLEDVYKFYINVGLFLEIDFINKIFKVHYSNTHSNDIKCISVPEIMYMRGEN